ncbi:hypothetical protein [Roseiconus lacunae]|uniref:hypothetical protein n=1 Tax=Roseiconus lacunae TaxID=2605694 RepID=UPI001E62F811|nr:hypothetical protein [Roseiconus lacunae]MCD0460252.1 hypothetical protein [Roseiconus lacunae]
MSNRFNLAIPTMVAVAFALLLGAQPVAEAGDFFDQTGASCNCPVCDHVCELKAEKVDEEKTCFKVESKVICIPRVVFPWQKSKRSACASCDACDGQGCTSCVHNGARLRRICVVKTEKYKCPSCEYTWTPVERGNCGGAGCASIPSGMIEAPLPPSPEPTPGATTDEARSVVEPISAADYFRIPAPSVSQLPSAPVLGAPSSVLFER